MINEWKLEISFKELYKNEYFDNMFQNNIYN